MKRRILTMTLAAALALSLTACGGGNSSSSGSNPGSSSSSSSSQPDASIPDASTPDASQPDASEPDGSQSSGSASGSVSSAEGLKPLPSITLTLNRTNIELNKAGATFQLRWTIEPETKDGVIFNVKDTKVATINEKGVITAVAPGKTTVTVECGGATATANINCKWEEASAPDASKPAEPTPAPANVDLASFYTTTTGKYDFAFMMEADADMLASFFAGLSDVSTAQQVVYLCGMSPSPNGDFALVQVNDSKDVDTVKAIFQARIDYMVGDGNGPGGAFYPEPTEMWQNNSRIVSNGNYSNIP